MSNWNYVLILLSCAVIFTSCQKEEGEPVVFIGDSLVEGWKANKYFPDYNISNESVIGAKIEEVLTWEIDATGKTAVFLIGTNNLGSISTLPLKFNLTFVDHYLHVIYTLQAQNNIVISLLPRQPAEHRPAINEEIKSLNKELKEVLAQHDNIEFLDVYDHFTKEGNIDHTYFSDGLHLSSKGYDLLSKLLAPVLERNVAVAQAIRQQSPIIH